MAMEQHSDGLDGRSSKCHAHCALRTGGKCAIQPTGLLPHRVRLLLGVSVPFGTIDTNRWLDGYQAHSCRPALYRKRRWPAPSPQGPFLIRKSHNTPAGSWRSAPPQSMTAAGVIAKRIPACRWPTGGCCLFGRSICNFQSARGIGPHL